MEEEDIQLEKLIDDTMTVFFTSVPADSSRRVKSQNGVRSSPDE